MASCNTEPVNSGNTSPGVRRVPCGPLEIAPRDRFYVPSALGDVLQLASPRVWTVEASVVVNCPPPSVGSSQTGVGEIQVNLDGLDLSDEQAAWLYENLDTTLIDLLVSSNPDDSVAPQLMLYPQQRQPLKQRFVDAAQAAQQQAGAMAASLLSCLFPSEPATVQCPAGAITTGNPVPPGMPAAVSSASAAAGDYFGTTQELANQARDLALNAQLVCVWANAEQTAQCAPSADIPPVPVPISGGPFPSLAGRQQIGSWTVPAGQVGSLVSQADANARALAAATSELDCFWVNQALPAEECPNLLTAGYADGPGNFLTQTPGSSIDIPAAVVASTVGVTEANTTAQQVARSLLVCRWISNSIAEPCPPVPPLYQGQVYLQTGETSQIDAGLIESYVSQADADAQATLIAQSLLNCIYCNEAIPATCAQTGLDGESVDRTTGAAAGSICGPSVEAVAASAISLASVPAPPPTILSGCRFTNQRVIVRCSSAFVLPPELDTTGAIFHYVDETNTDYDQNRSTPYVVIEAGSVSILRAPGGSMTPQQDANEQAILLGLSTLDCVFTNDQQTGTCPNNLVTVNQGNIPAGFVVSTVSKADANSQATTMANALSICMDPDAYNAAPNGPPGPAGPSGNCSSTCHGVWG